MLCSANFKAYNDSAAYNFKVEGKVIYDIELVGKEAVAAIPNSYIKGNRNPEYESMPTRLLISNIYAKYKIEKKM